MAHAGQPDIATIVHGVNAAFLGGMEAATPDWRRFFSMERMTTKRKLMRGLLGVGELEEEKGQPIKFHEDAELNFEIRIRNYSVGHTLHNDDVADDTDSILGDASRVGRELSERTGLKFRRDAFGLVAKGNTTTEGSCFDGGAFFRIDHPMVDLPTVTNPFWPSGLTAEQPNYIDGAANPWVLLTTRRAYKPFGWAERQAPKLTSQTDPSSDPMFEEEKMRFKVRARYSPFYGRWLYAVMSKAAFDRDAYIAARTMLRELRDYTGAPMDLEPDLIICEPDIEIPVREVVRASTNAAGATNVLNGDVDVLSTGFMKLA